MSDVLGLQAAGQEQCWKRGSVHQIDQRLLSCRTGSGVWSPARGSLVLGSSHRRIYLPRLPFGDGQGRSILTSSIRRDGKFGSSIRWVQSLPLGDADVRSRGGWCKFGSGAGVGGKAPF